MNILYIVHEGSSNPVSYHNVQALETKYYGHPVVFHNFKLNLYLHQHTRTELNGII